MNSCAFTKTTTLVITTLIAISSAFAKPNIGALTSKKKSESLDVASSTKSAGGIAPTGSILNVHSVGLGVGETFLKGDMKDNGEDRITWDLFYTYAASHSFDFMASFHSSSHKFQGRKSSVTGLALGLKAKAFQFDNFSPFVNGGLGFYWPKMRRLVDGDLTETETKTTFGMHLGAGGDLRLNRHFSVGIMGQYHNPFDVRQEEGPEVEGSYFKLLITGFYTF